MENIPVIADYLAIVLGMLIAILGGWMWSKDRKTRLGAIAIVVAGLAITMVGITRLPSTMLKRWSGEVEAEPRVSAPDALPPPVGDDDSGEEDNKTIMIMGTRKELREFFLSFVREELEQIQPDAVPEPSPEDGIVIQEDREAGRDPFQASPIPTPEPTPAPPPPAPVRERTLATEPADRNAACTHFTLLHGASGGPGEGGCFAVGCSEGYALPMQWKDGEGWLPCPAPTRLERLGECYWVHDADGSERSMRLDQGEWKHGTCK